MAHHGGLRVDQARRLKRLEPENSRLKRAVADLTLDNQILRGVGGKLLSPSRRRQCVDHAKEIFGVSLRRACRVLGHPRSTQRYEPSPLDDEKALTEEIVEVASQFGRYGYRRITALMRHRGSHVNHNRLERIW